MIFWLKCATSVLEIPVDLPSLGPGQGIPQGQAIVHTHAREQHRGQEVSTWPCFALLTIVL